MKITVKDDKPHKLFSASAAHRWTTCPAAVALSSKAPRTSSKFADEGTAAHAVCERALNDKTRRRGAGVASYVGGTVEVNGQDYEITEEMAAAVEEYLDVVDEECRDEVATLAVEQEFGLPWVGDDVGGTCDAAILSGRKITVVDFKYGRGVAVPAERNPQMCIYALGAMGLKNAPKVDVIELVIVQPRGQGDTVKRWKTTPAELLSWMHDVLIPTYHRAKKAYGDFQHGKQPLGAIGEHCLFCPAKTACAAYTTDLQLVARAQLAETGMLYFPDPSAMSGKDISTLLEHADRLEQFAEAVRVRARHCADSGIVIPGWKLVATKGNRKWKEGAEEELKKKLGQKAYAAPKLLSPAQVEKLRELGEEELGQLVERPVTGKALVRASDKRPALASPASAELLSSADWLQ